MPKLKYYLFILSFILSRFVTAENYSIVFIHIGDDIPAYAMVAMQQAKLFNPQASIIMVANQRALKRFESREAKIYSFISIESLRITVAHKKFIQESLKNGFWRYTSERFLVLHDLMQKFRMVNVFHLEYDNMLYVDLQKLLHVFKNHYKGIAATFDNNERCIPGFIYIPNRKHMDTLANYFANLASQKLNDMQIVAKYKNSYGSEMIDYLPIAPNEYVSTEEMVSKKGHVVKNPQKYSNCISLFNSLFDAAAIGQYLGGIDLHNGHSKPGFINESSVVNPSLFNYEWIIDANKRKVPFITYKGTKYRINNLHIHSKALEGFKSL